jgi:pectate lyase
MSTMFKKLRILLALLYAVPAFAQTSTTTTAGVVNITVPLQVLAPAGCTVDFSSAVTLPVITVANCPASQPVTTPPPTPVPTTPPPDPTPPSDPTPPPDPTPAPNANLAAFPGAQGSAASSRGGRGGTVIEVANLNDSGAGSLRACVTASGPRTCVFRVAGLFPITSADLRFSSPYLTVAGQTAPGEVILGGPNTGGALFGVSTHDVILRYVTLSPDNFKTPSGPDTGTTSIWIVNCPGNGTKTSGGCYNIMIDHVTTRWSGNKSWITTSNFTPGDKNGNGSGPNHDITTQWSLDYEPHEGHPVGFGTATDETCVGTREDGNCLSPYEVNIDFHHNMLVNVHHRIPENSNGSTRWINNVIFNWGWYANEWLGAEIIDAINNKYITGNLNSSAQAFPIHFTTNSPEMSGAPSVYVAGNIYGGHGANTVNSDQYGQLVNQITGENGNETGPIPSTWARLSPMPASNIFPIVPDPAASLDAILLPTIGNSQHLDCNGNWVSHRDAADTRILAQYQSGGSGGYWPNGVTFTGQATIPQPTADWQDAPVVNGPPCVESLRDGIPDQWKKNNKLSTTDSNLYKKIDKKTGYTYLEEYLAGSGTTVTPPAPPAPTPATSPSGTTVTPTNGATIVDAQANSWALGAAVPVTSNPDCTPNSCGNVVMQNGNSQNGTAATLILWLNNALYQSNAAGNWWTWTASAWKKVPGDPRSAQ